MTKDCQEQPIGVSGVNNNLGNLLAVAETKSNPCLARVGGLVHAIARRQIGALHAFPAAHVNHVRIRRRHGDRANGTRRLVIEDWRPRSPGIVVFHTPPFTAPANTCGCDAMPSTALVRRRGTDRVPPFEFFE